MPKDLLQMNPFKKLKRILSMLVGKPLPSLIVDSLKLYDITSERAPFLFRKESYTITALGLLLHYLQA